MAASSSSVAEVAMAAAAAAAMESAFPQEQQQAPPRPQGGGAKSRHHAYSRKEKSLGLLCSNFVVLYNREDVESIGLDEAAKRLGVERRRIYDIVNVLESVGERALREKSGLAPLQTEQQSSATMSDDEDDDKLGNPDGDIENEKLSQTMDNRSDKPGAPRCRLRSDHRKEKSLGLLTQNFVKLFLTMEVDTISLDEAAKLLLGEGHEETNMRTKVRRLYDIANVLSSLNLIEKIQQGDTRKPAFRWLGRAVIPNAENGVTVAVPPPEKISRLGQGKTSGFVYGPFHPAGARKHELDGSNKPGQRERAEDWESLSASFRPQYQNQGHLAIVHYGHLTIVSTFMRNVVVTLGDLFAHYVEAWKTWYSELAQGSKQQHFSQSVNHFL
ncbi:E2F transcription factor-like E2FF [Dichanthelium oligosanthes]|uniref:E2F transcription factor-like E2FF n=1 Tax=Dichanthelium oligosanthes TaxID=888268 RepID=A0A1E5WGM5_9POAL|nr:E2F transcription factor-like E2FF [Dichanthelium oligosanthes]